MNRMAEEDSKLLRFFRKVGDAVLNLGKLPEKVRKVRSSFSLSPKKSQKEIPSLLEGIFRRRNAGWPEYVMLKVQISLILLFVSAAIFIIIPSAPTIILAPLILIFAGHALYLIPTQLKPAFSRDCSAYRSFVVLCVAIALGLVLILRNLTFQVLESPFTAMAPAVLVLGVVLGAFAVFRLKYGRNYTYGTVREVRESKASVKLGYDIRSNAKHGVHFLETLADVEPGDEVKVGVDRSLWGFRGSEPTAVLEKVE